MRYPVTLTKDDNHTILVTFPDVAEAITYGDTVEEALERAPDALLTIFDIFMKDKRDIPAPTAIEGPYVDLPALEAAKLNLYRTMRERHVTKAELGRRMNVHLPQVDRILNVRHASHFEQMEAAFAAVGKRLVIDTADLVPVTVKITASTLRRHPAKRQPSHHGRILTRARNERSHMHAAVGRTAGTRKIAAKKR